MVPITQSDDHVDALDRAWSSLSPDTQDVAQRAARLLSGRGGVYGTPNVAANAPTAAKPEETASLETPQSGETPMAAAAAMPKATPRADVQAQPQPPTDTMPMRTLPRPPSLSRVPSPAESKLDALYNAPAPYSQIKRPWLRVPAEIASTIGSIVTPGLMRFVPGSQENRNVQIGRTQSQLKTEQGEQKAADESALHNAQTREAEANTERTLNPTPKQEEAGKTVVADGKVKQWNPKTQAYDIEVGEAPNSKNGTVHQLEDGSMIVAHPDGTATPLTMNGQSVKGKVAVKEDDQPLSNVADVNTALTRRYQVLHPNQSLPADLTLGDKATKGDFSRVDKLMEQEEKALASKGQQDAAVEARKQTHELARMRFSEEQNRNADQKNEREHKQDVALKQATKKEFEPATDSAERFNVMAKNYEDAVKNHDQQAMLSLLANHLGMTMGLQKGARLNQAIISEAQKSQPWLSGLKAKFSKDGYLTGVTLSPQQMQSMVNLGRERFAEDVKKGRAGAKYIGATDEGPERIPSRSTMSHYLDLNHNDVAKAKQQAAEDGWTVK